MHLCFLHVVQDCDKFQSKSQVSPAALESAQSGCLRVMEPGSAEHRGLPRDACRTRCRLSSGVHLKINNINDDFSLLVSTVCALRTDAITLPGMQNPPTPPSLLRKLHVHHFLVRFNISRLKTSDLNTS